MESVSFPDANNGWVVGASYQVGNGAITRSAVIFHTPDGGATWNQQTLANAQDRVLRSVYFLDAKVGWAGGDGIRARTTDGGITWDSHSSRSIYQVYFVNPSQGWLATDDGVYRSFDGGQTWQPNTTITKGEKVFGIHFVDGENGWAVGEAGNIWVTTNGGQDWHTQPAGNKVTNKDLLAVYFPDVNHGFIVGGTGLMRDLEVVRDTSPNRARHVVLSDGCSWDSGFNRYDPSTQKTEWVQVPYTHCPQSPTPPSRVRLETLNHGETWSVIEEEKQDPLTRILFKDPLHGWMLAGTEYWASSRSDAAVWPSGSILATEDGGNHWKVQSESPFLVPLYGISFFDVNRGMAVGNRTGYLWKAAKPPHDPEQVPYRCRVVPGQPTPDCRYGEYGTYSMPIGGVWRTDKGGKP